MDIERSSVQSSQSYGACQIQSLQVEQPAVPGPLRIVITSPSQTAADGNPCQSPIIAASRGSKSDGNSKSNNSGRAENAWCSSPLEAALLQHAQGRLHAAVKGPLGAGSIGLIHRQGLRELLPWQSGQSEGTTSMTWADRRAYRILKHFMNSLCHQSMQDGSFQAAGKRSADGPPEPGTTTKRLAILAEAMPALHVYEQPHSAAVLAESQASEMQTSTQQLEQRQQLLGSASHDPEEGCMSNVDPVANPAPDASSSAALGQCDGDVSGSSADVTQPEDDVSCGSSAVDPPITLERVDEAGKSSSRSSSRGVVPLETVEAATRGLKSGHNIIKKIAEMVPKEQPSWPAMCREIVRPGQTLQGAMVIEGAPSMPDVAAKAAVMAGAERSPLAGEECSRYARQFGRFLGCGDGEDGVRPINLVARAALNRYLHSCVGQVKEEVWSDLNGEVGTPLLKKLLNKNLANRQRRSRMGTHLTVAAPVAAVQA